MQIIDAHSHLWLNQNTVVDGQPIRSLKSNPSRSEFFGEERQMLPPFMIDGRNTAEVFLSNMDYAQVGAAVVVQEVIDGNQNDYLAIVQNQYPDRFFCMGMLTDIDTKDDLAQHVKALNSRELLEVIRQQFPSVPLTHSTRVHLGLAMKELGYTSTKRGNISYYKVIPTKVA